MGILSQGIGSVKLCKLLRGRWSFGGDKLGMIRLSQTCSESLQSSGRLGRIWWLLPVEAQCVGCAFRYQDKLLLGLQFPVVPGSLVGDSSTRLGCVRGSCSWDRLGTGMGSTHPQLLLHTEHSGLGTDTSSCTISPGWTFEDGFSVF